MIWRALLIAAVAALAGARLGYGLLHAGYYANEPLELLKLWKDGFLPWAGAATALLAAWLAGRRYRLGARPILPVLAGVLIGAALQGLGGWRTPEVNVRLPPLALETLAHTPVHLTDFQGQPMAVNLWASWCPPCRQEMPALAAAQEGHPEIAFLYVNQGEDGATIARYLEEEALALSQVLRDPHSSASKVLHAAALPTTLFFDAEGRLVSAYTGELTPPRLEDHLRALARRSR